MAEINNSSINTKECEMKNLLLTLVTFSVLLLIGCQENSIVDPIQDTGLQKNDDPSVKNGSMRLEGLILDRTVPFTNYLSINGAIEYVHELIVPVSQAPQYYVSLNLNVNAELSNPSTPEVPVWTISEQTEDLLYVSEDGIYLLEKTFQIQGREDGMVLKCRFLVTTDGIGLNQMWLALSNDNSSIHSQNKSVEPDLYPLPPVKNNLPYTQ